MRKFVTLIAGVSLLCGMTALAQSNAPGGGTSQGNPVDEQIAQAHRMAGILVRAIREGVQDPATWPLVSKALTDRTAMLNAELNRVAMLQALFTAAQGGDRAAIQTARGNLRTATETVAEAAKKFTQDIGAIRIHLQSERGANPGAGGTGTAAPQSTK
jgi:hypothetical protein